MEILAPVGGFKQLKAAIVAKADAIYIGNDRFSARSGAENFSLADIAELVKACHHENIKVYLAVNTLFKDDEIIEALNLCVDAYNLGVDAIIIQDFGLLNLLENYYPEIEKHASTQMSIHNLAGAQFAKIHGINRVVLARELSLTEIKEITNTGIETEVFIHGAICISYSGQCLFSSLNGDRSANRGRCAQPCRKPYNLLEDGKVIDSGFLISPKDRAYIHNMQDLKNAGITSFKIEGRLRNEYYVYESISQYKNALSGKEYSIEKMGQIFKRDEFSNTYLYDKASSNFITKAGGSNKGIFMGKVKNDRIELACDLELSDGIKSAKGGFILTKMLENGKSIRLAPKGSIVELFPKKYKNGDLLYKTNSFSQKKRIDKTLADYKTKQKVIDVNVDFCIDKPLKIANNDLVVEDGKVEQAVKSPVAKEKIIQNIEKSASDYIKLRVKNLNYESGFIRISDLNKARRKFIELYEDKFLSKQKALKKADVKICFPKNATKNNLKMIIISKLSELSAFDSNIKVALNPFTNQFDAIDFVKVKQLDQKGFKYYLKTPTIIRQEIDDICDFIMALQGLEGIITANLGLIAKFKGKTKIIGYYDLNVINSYSVDFFEDLEYVIPSPEMSKNELAKIAIKSRLMPMIYGNIKYMNMEYSPIENLNQTKEQEYQLEDKGRKTIIKTDLFKRVTLYANKPLNHSYKLDEYKKMGYNSFIIEPIKYDDFNTLLSSFESEQGFFEEALFHYDKGIL